MRAFQAHLIVFAALLGLAAGTFAQSRPDGGDRPRRGQIRPGDRPDDGPGRPPPPGSAEDDGELQLARMPGPNPFRRLREDFADVSAEEEQDLLEFARHQQPRLYEGLKQLRSKAPDRYKARFTEIASRLRMLRRLFSTRPLAAADFVRHMENMSEIFRAMRDWSRSTGVRRQNIENEVQRRVADNLNVELRLIDDRISDLDANRDRYSKEEAERLTAPDAELPPGPPTLLQHIREFRSADDDTARQEALGDVELEVWLILDDQLQDLRERSETLREDRATVIRDRVEGFKKRASMLPKRDGDGPEHRPGDRPREGPGRIRRPSRP